MAVRRLFFVVTLMMAGCSHSKVIQIDSEPPGANIDFDGAYLGKTPIVQEVKRGRNEWSNRIYASEVKGTLGECTEIKRIGKDQETPDKMFFDFSACAKKKPGGGIESAK